MQRTEPENNGRIITTQTKEINVHLLKPTHETDFTHLTDERSRYCEADPEDGRRQTRVCGSYIKGGRGGVADDER